MPTINAGKKGFIYNSAGDPNFTKQRETGSAISTNPTGNEAIAFSFLRSSDRVTTNYKFYRTFIYFDTSTITTTPSAARMEIEGELNGTGDYIIVSSSAFGGDGQSTLAGGDYFASLNYSAPYSSEFTSWNTSGTNLLSLNSTALADIENNNYFICAIIDHDYDYNNNSGTGNITNNHGIAFGTTIVLNVTTAAGPTKVAAVNGVTAANIGKWDGTSWSDITALDGVS